MANQLPGPHHCIGSARAATEIVFRVLRTQCEAAGGSLSLGELESLHSKIIDSFSSGFELFELKHLECMKASWGAINTPFARDKILATLLRACWEKFVRAAFSLQVGQLGAIWIGEFFDSLAEYMREHVHTNIDARLINAYANAAMIPNIKLTIDEFIKQETVQQVLFECVAALESPGGPEVKAHEVCNYVNASVARRRGVTGRHVCKTTEDETRRFLTMLPQLLLGAKAAPYVTAK